METINVPIDVLKKLLDAIYFAVDPYIDNVSTKEDFKELKENYPWIVELCEAHDKLLSLCPDEIKNEFDFIIENE